MPPLLHVLAILSLVIALLCALWIAWDERGRSQHMWIMNLVWPLCALFGGPLVLWAYLAVGRGMKGRMHHEGHDHGHEGHGKEGHDHAGHDHAGHDASGADHAGRDPSAHDHGQHAQHDHGHMSHGNSPFAVSVAKGVLHCGSGCTLGDIIAETLAFLFPAVAVALGWHWIFPEKIFAVWVLDFILAFGFGVAFQYFAIKPMRDLTVRDGIIQALKADAASLSSWQVGMYGFMAIAHFWIFPAVIGTPLRPMTPEFWFMMQIAMLCGFVTAFPVNWLLIRKGVKEAM